MDDIMPVPNSVLNDVAPQCLSDYGRACFDEFTNRSKTAQSTATFQAGDWAVLGFAMAISTLIGLYWAWKDRNKSINEYMLGGGSLSPLPIAMSQAVTFCSALTVLGTPVEFYLYGTMFSYFVVTYFICTVLCAEFFGPMYREFGYTSMYEYMETRFHYSVRVMTTLIYIVKTITYAGMAIYAPALALETVTGLGKWQSVWLTGGVCIFYTSIGGLKAVVWTDSVQLFILLAGFFGILAKGVAEFGFNDILNHYDAGGRIVWDDFTFDPRVRHTFWSIVIGGVFGDFGNSWCASQNMMQRVLACRNKRDIRISLYTAWALITGIMVICGLTGAVLYRFYACCDPLKAGWVESSDQLVPYLAIEQFQDYPGVAGLYIAGAYCGCLSTVSSCINSMATVIVTDFIAPNEFSIERHLNFKLTERVYLFLSKLLSVALGLTCIGFAYLAANLGGILQAAFSISNVIGGAHFAVFILAFVNPYANRWGAHVGFLTGLAASAWLYIGAKDSDYPVPSRFTKKLNIETVGCLSVNSSQWCDADSEVDLEDTPAIHNMYWLSYMLLGTVGFVTCFVTGSLVSVLTGGQDPRKLPRYVLLPVIDRCFERYTKCDKMSLVKCEEDLDKSKSA